MDTDIVQKAPNDCSRTDNVFQMPCNLTGHYDVIMIPHFLSERLDLFKNRQALLITTPTVAQLYGPRFNAFAERNELHVEHLVLECNEQTKTLDIVSRVCQHALEIGLKRNDILIAMGGGVCSDITTVVASLIRRGVSHLRIPTTLIGQIDASVGIKGAINFFGKKSYLGCYHPPLAVLIDPTFLATLPRQYIRFGLAEMLKIAIVCDAELFEIISAHSSELIRTGFQFPSDYAHRALWLAARRMLEELAPNLYENHTFQRLVDFGHTFSPLLEAASNFTIQHGEAVAIDIALSVIISEHLGFMSNTDCTSILSTIVSVGLPLFSNLLTYELCIKALEEAARHRGGALNMVLPVDIGRAVFLKSVEDLNDHLLLKALHRLAAVQSM